MICKIKKISIQLWKYFEVTKLPVIVFMDKPILRQHKSVAHINKVK